MERLTIRYNEEKVPFCPPCIKCATRCDECEHLDKMMYKLADYEDAEEQGLLLRLPCKIGTTVYAIYGNKVTKGALIRQNSISFLDDFGKTVFLTKEEAEQALKQMGE